MKKCTKCLQVKLLEDYHVDISRKDGRTSACKICRTKHTTSYHKKNKTWLTDKHRKYAKERSVEWRKDSKNRKIASNSTRKSQEKNPDKFIPYNRALASIKRVKQRYPDNICGSIEDVLPAYKKAYTMECQTGQKYQVDHKKPLVFGGEHLLDNLQVITYDAHKEKTSKEVSVIREILKQNWKENLL